MNKKSNDDYERYFFSFYTCLYLIIEVSIFIYQISLV